MSAGSLPATAPLRTTSPRGSPRDRYQRCVLATLAYGNTRLTSPCPPTLWPLVRHRRSRAGVQARFSSTLRTRSAPQPPALVPSGGQQATRELDTVGSPSRRAFRCHLPGRQQPASISPPPPCHLDRAKAKPVRRGSAPPPAQPSKIGCSSQVPPSARSTCRS